jgi:hypothetical protein
MSADQPRDDHGRWTASGVGTSDAHAHPAGPFMDISKPDQAEKADQVAKIAATVANKLGYDPSKINVSDESRQFELNGKTMNYAGMATFPADPKLVVNPDGSKTIANANETGPVTLFTPHVGNDPNGIAGVAAHEITHQKWQAFRNDYTADMLKMKEDPDYQKNDKWVTYDANNPQHAALRAAGSMVTSPQEDGSEKIREPGFMRPDGMLNEPYASKYPAYQSMTNALKPSQDDFAKSDGVSDYSKEYWLGARTPVEKSFDKPDGTKQTYSTYAVDPAMAFHETLSEIGRLKYAGDPVYHKKLGDVDGKPVYFSTGKKGINPKWNTLYKAMDDNWKRRTSK